MFTPSPAQEPASSLASADTATMPLDGQRRRFRFDGLFWRRFGYLGATRGPVWWQRVGPAVVAAIVFAVATENRRGAVANLRAILGTKGWLGDHLRALRLFSEFAYCTTDVWQHEAATDASDVERDIEIVAPPEFDIATV